MSEQRIRALVTGASSGLGVDFCRQLAGRCDEIILVARRQDRLQALADELQQLGVDASVAVADLASTIGIASVVEIIRQRGPLTYLVNNAGFSTLGNFVAQDLHSQQAMVSVHITATMALSQAALAGMRVQRQGFIINVASVVGLLPYAGVAVYGGTKAFLANFSEALQAEVKQDGIFVQCLCPGYTRTGFHTTPAFADFNAAAVPAGLWMNSADVVTASLSALGSEQVVLVAGGVNQQMVAERLQTQLRQHRPTGGVAE